MVPEYRGSRILYSGCTAGGQAVQPLKSLRRGLFSAAELTRRRRQTQQQGTESSQALALCAALPEGEQHNDAFVAGDRPALFGCPSAFEQFLTPTRQVSEPKQVGRPQQSCAAADAASRLQQGHTCGHNAASAWEERPRASFSGKCCAQTLKLLAQALKLLYSGSVQSSII